MSEAANSNNSTSNGGGKQKESTDLALKRVKKRNEELKPFADIIKREKGEKNVKEKKRIDHLRTSMIAAHYCTRVRIIVSPCSHKFYIIC